MNPINLLHYTSSRKIPHRILSGAYPKPQVPMLKTLAAYYLDFTYVFSFTLLTSVFLIQSFNSLLLSKKLEASLIAGSMGMVMVIFPLILAGYFFFCYFLNHGQSLGQQALKQRVSMRDKDLYSAWTAGLLSAAVILSCGLLFKWVMNKLKMEPHDYLYHDLLTIKEIEAPGLRDLLQAKILKEEEKSFEIKKAA